MSEKRGAGEDLRAIFAAAAGQSPAHYKEQLAWRHMVALADTFEGWALDHRLAPEQTAQLVGWAESLRALAEEVGSDWNPPHPERFTLVGFLGRFVLEEETGRGKK